MTRMEAEFVQREAPPSYGQLIAQGLIPPVEDFPVYNPTQVMHSHTIMLSGTRFAEMQDLRMHVKQASFCKLYMWLWLD